MEQPRLGLRGRTECLGLAHACVPSCLQPAPVRLLPQDLGSLIEDVVVGAGPCGELRLPSYVEANGWRFPGVGEFQCYDRHALASLAAAAQRVGRPEWGYTGPHDAGHYTSTPESTGFFSEDGSWDTPYGR